LSLSARHIVQPQVGVSAILSALGNLKAPWEQTGVKQTPLNSARGEAPESARQYQVGRSRAKEQLNMAFATKDEVARLRRLEHALDTPAVRYDEALTPRLVAASNQVSNLSKALHHEDLTARRVKADAAAAAGKKLLTAAPAAAAAPEEQGPEPETPAEEEEAADGEEDMSAEEAAAALRIQSIYRGKQEREAVKVQQKQAAKEAAEEKDAAIKIQSIFRGKASRAAGGASESIAE